MVQKFTEARRMTNRRKKNFWNAVGVPVEMAPQEAKSEQDRFLQKLKGLKFWQLGRQITQARNRYNKAGRILETLHAGSQYRRPLEQERLLLIYKLGWIQDEINARAGRAEAKRIAEAPASEEVK